MIVIKFYADEACAADKVMCINSHNNMLLCSNKNISPNACCFFFFKLTSVYGMDKHHVNPS